MNPSAETVGGGVAPDYPNPGSWFPTSLVPYSDGSTGVYAHLIERGKPGVIAVNLAGNRFTDEAQNYHDFVSAMLAMPRTHRHSMRKAPVPRRNMSALICTIWCG